MSSRKFIGIDPGKTGHICVLDEGGSIEKIRFPMIGNDYDIWQMVDIFKEWSTPNCHVVIEDVKALQPPFQSANWSLSRSKTILEVLCVALGVSFTMVPAKRWQKEVWKGVAIQKKPTSRRNKKGEPVYITDTKNTSLVAIKRLFPNVDLRASERARKPDDGVVDALALAYYCKLNKL
jgi:hypothetical protein